MYRRRTVPLLLQRRYTKGKSCSLLVLPCHVSRETGTLSAPHRLDATSPWGIVTEPRGSHLAGGSQLERRLGRQ